MSKNVFDILLNPNKRKAEKREDSRIKSLVSDNLRFKKTEEDDEDIFNQLEVVGEEKDKEDYLGDIEKLSMRELDSKPEREQLRILKLSYNKIFERAESLSKQLNDRDREVRDIKMENSNLLQRITGFRDAYRDLVMHIPGEPELKNLINQGNWKREDVAPLLELAINNLNERFTNTDKIIKETENRYLEMLKEKDSEIEEYSSIVEDLLELEKQIESLLIGEEKPTKENIKSETNIDEKPKSIAEKVEEINYKKTSEGKLDLDLKEREENKKQNKSIDKKEYKPHFAETFSDKDNNEEEKNKPPIKKENTSNLREEILKKHKKNKTSINTNDPPPSPIKMDDSREQHDHPLSPNYKEIEKQKVSEIFDENINSYLNNISNKQEYILKIIGETGISRNSDLRDFLLKDEKGMELFGKNKKVDYQSLSSEVASLRGSQILEDEKLSLGGRGGGASQVVYELSSVGKQCFKMLFEDDPVVPEKKRVVDMHGSLEHGYMIKDSAIIFSEMGFETFTKNEDITFKVSNGRRKVFDLLIKDKDEKIMHIEVERGTHNKEDFFDAMDRIFEITNEFYFICPNDAILNGTTKKHFFEWIKERLGGVNNADLILNTTTMASLRRKPKNIWSTTDLRKFKK